MSGVRRFLGHRAAVAGAVLLVLLVGLAVVQPGGDPVVLDLETGLTELGAPLPPSGDALLGTDHLGRDVWARLVAGAASSLAIAALATLLALGIGVAFGLVAGYVGGWVDTALMRLVDLVLAFPFLLLAILLAALLRESELGRSSVPVVLALAAVGWTTIARVIRGKAALLERSELVVAARALGASPLRIVVRHVLPNVGGLALAIAMIAFAQNLIAESVLSFLGLGPPPPAASWGRMLAEGRAYYRTAPHLVIAPGAAILLAVIAVHLVGEGVRRTLDLEDRR